MSLESMEGGDEPETLFLCLLDIQHEACIIDSVVLHRRSVLLQISLFIVLPLCVLYLAQIEISEIMFREIAHNQCMLDAAPQGTQLHTRISNMLTTIWAAFIFFKISHWLLFILLALFPISAVACIYAGYHIPLVKGKNVVPKVGKRLLHTFLRSFIIVFAYDMVALVALILGVVPFWSKPIMGKVLLFGFPFLYLSGYFYITILWHLASVVSVLEETSGVNAVTKTQILTKGKTKGIASEVFLILGLSLFGIEHAFNFLVAFGCAGIGRRIGIGVICLILLSTSTLFGLVGQTITYFVCKGHRSESIIGKSSLAALLSAYFAPLRSDLLPSEEQVVLV